ncbi:MAG TPA: nuclear transport factor 2 family protein [Candidatus Nanoarchaeia archaeon]|nr:nuclear transport factor 2 family protein [Candidatus Nanoarchaeia archaeon]
MKKIQAEVENFLQEYEKATNSHNFDNVRKFLLKEAVYFFSDGNLKEGRGRGTNILVKKKGRWYISHEHLSTL